MPQLCFVATSVSGEPGIHRRLRRPLLLHAKQLQLLVPHNMLLRGLLLLCHLLLLHHVLQLQLRAVHGHHLCWG
jgi:hypothetical protein